VVLPGGLAMGFLGPFIGRAYDRFGARRLVLPGAFLLCAALWTMTTLDDGSPIWEVVIAQTVMMVSLAMMFTPLMTDSLGSLPSELYSHGSAILTTLQQVAGAAGTALFVTVMTLSSASGGAPDVPGVQAAFTVAAVISIVVVITAFFTGREPATQEAVPAH
jgi:DHA2 family lincomycin resistance protein-like MFS transporter